MLLIVPDEGFFEKPDVRIILDIYVLLYTNVIVKMSSKIDLLELEWTQSEGFK